MKNLFLATVVTALLPLTSFAAPVISATSLKVISPDGRTDLKNINATLNVLCKYSINKLFDRVTKVCGDKTIKLEIVDGVIKIPAVETYSGLQGAKLSNYDLYLRIFEGETHLASILAGNKTTIGKFKFDKNTLSVFRFNASEVNLSYNGADFFGSDLAKNKDASMMVILRDTVTTISFDEPSVLSPGTSDLWSRNNSAISGRELLQDTKSISIPAFAYAKLDARANEKVVFGVYYSVYGDVVKAKDLQAVKGLEVKPIALEEIGSLELK